MGVDPAPFTVAIAGASLPEDDGKRNADAIGRAVCETESGSVHALIVCDGVSSSPRGADAAEQACRLFTARATDYLLSHLSLSDALRELIVGIHRAVRGEFGGEGVCCAAAALVAPGRRRIAIANVGDSPVFLWMSGVLQELSHLHIAALPVHRNGRIVLHPDGTPVIAMGVEQAIGSFGEVAPHIAEMAVDGDGEVLCLTSDGVKRTRLEQFLVNVDGRATDADVAGFCLEMRQESVDDTTLLVAILGESRDVTESRALCLEYTRASGPERDQLLSRIEQSTGVDVAIIAECLRGEVVAVRASRLLVLLERHPRSLDRTSWIGILDAISAQPQLRQFARRVAAILGRL